MTIVIDEVSLRFEEKQVLQDFSYTLPDQGIICFFGPSGCGKTTLLHLLSGLRQADSGRIQGLEGKRISVVFQEDRLLPWLPAGENISLVLDGQDNSPQPWLDLVELAAERNHQPAELSGGMQRRLAIARALAFNGDVLLLDEPFNGLDGALALRIMRRIQEQYQGRLVVLITHDRVLAEQAADKIVRVGGPPLTILDTAIIT